MSVDASAKERLAEHSRALGEMNPAWNSWGRFEAWISSFRPFVRRYFPDLMGDFNDAGRKPKWLSLPRIGCSTLRADQAFHQEQLTNDRYVQETKDKLIAFVDRLAQLLPDGAGGGSSPSHDGRRVFIIHGANASAYAELAKYLMALKLAPRSLFDVGGEMDPNPNIMRIVKHGMREAAGVIAFFTPEEWPVLTTLAQPTNGQGTGHSQARINAIFGAGLALGVAAKRTLVVGLGADVGLLADFRDVHSVSLDNGAESRHLLRQKLKAVGCAPDMETDDHLNLTTAGDFSRWLRPAHHDAETDNSGWTAP